MPFIYDRRYQPRPQGPPRENSHAEGPGDEVAQISDFSVDAIGNLRYDDYATKTAVKPLHRVWAEYESSTGKITNRTRLVFNEFSAPNFDEICFQDVQVA